MFAVIRHASYSLGSGSLTQEGVSAAETLAQKLVATGTLWREIRTSPTARSKETAVIVGRVMNVDVEEDERIGMDGNFVDLLPPTEPHGIVLVSHLPVLTKMLRAWSKSFGQDEPPLTEVASGYLIDPEKKKIEPITP